MASPGEFKGQRKGSCVLANDCLICEGFSDVQKEKLATPSYKIRKERKAGLLVSPQKSDCPW